jgi:hypothetical protein
MLIDSINQSTTEPHIIPRQRSIISQTGWISPKEALRRYNQRRRDKKREKLALAHPLPLTPTSESSACTSTASIDPIVEFSGRGIILKTCTPVRPPADPAMAVNLRRSSVDIWDRVDEDRREM